MCEPIEVIGSIYHLLHEGSFHIDQSILLQNSVDLANASRWISQTLQHCLQHDRVKSALRKWKLMRVTDKLRPWPKRNVCFHELNARICQKGFHPITQNASTDNQNSGIRRLTQEQPGKFLVIPFALDIPAQPWEQPLDRPLDRMIRQVKSRLAMRNKVIDGKQAGIVVYQDRHAIDRWKLRVAGWIGAGEQIVYPRKFAFATRTTKQLLNSV